jgi:hypothetical protein
MMQMWKFTPVLLLAVLSGCVTMPVGPSVNVMPAPGKPFEKFQGEDATCRRWAQGQLAVPTQQKQEETVATGAVAGTAIGAGVGAVFGAASHHAGAGAAIGAATGLLFGSAVGAGEADEYGVEAQRRYDNAYVQCMYSYGNQIPGHYMPAKARAAAPPPPPPATPPPAPVAFNPAPPEVVAPPPTVAVAPPPVVVTPPPQVIVAPPPPPIVITQPQYYGPDEVYFDQAPQFVYSPPLNMYVAVGTPYDLVYTGSEYYYFYGGRWYRSPYYNGPWVYAAPASRPRIFAQYRIDRIRHYREMEYRRYMREGDRYRGHLHRPAFRSAERHRHEDRR